MAGSLCSSDGWFYGSSGMGFLMMQQRKKQTGDVADVTEALVGLWKDSAGDIYGFYNDYSFFGQWVDEEQDVLGAYALASDGDYTALVMQLANDDGTYDEEK